MTSKIFTIGYEGLKQNDVVAKLRDASVELLIDVRFRPLSRKAGLSKRALSAALDEVGIAYAHDAGLGTPPDVLSDLRTSGLYDWDRYREFLDSQDQAVRWAVDLAENQRVALLCFEALPSECHRHIVAQTLSSTLGHSVIDL
jgi:uncharacterized protein (DUF488 family)